jgi:hypothetical protein
MLERNQAIKTIYINKKKKRKKKKGGVHEIEKKTTNFNALTRTN